MHLRPENDLTRVDSLPQQRTLDPGQEAAGPEPSSDDKQPDRRPRRAHQDALEDTIPILFDDRNSADKFGSKAC